MHRRPQGSSSGSEQKQKQQQTQTQKQQTAHDASPRAVSPSEDEDGDKDVFPIFTNGHVDGGAEPEKKDTVDAGLKSLDHCTYAPLIATRTS